MCETKTHSHYTTVIYSRCLLFPKIFSTNWKFASETHSREKVKQEADVQEVGLINSDSGIEAENQKRNDNGEKESERQSERCVEVERSDCCLSVIFSSNYGSALYGANFQQH